MPTGVTRILPFAVISAALHAAVLINAPERLEIAVTPGGDTGPIAVRLVPSGATPSEPATRSEDAGPASGSPPQPHGPPGPTATAAQADSTEERISGDSPGASEPEATQPDRVQAAPADRITAEIARNNTHRERADTATTDSKEQPDESAATPATAEKSAEAVAAAKNGTPDIRDTPQAPEASETAETPEPAHTGKASAAEADATTAEASDRTPRPDDSEAADDARQSTEPSGADGADDRAQLASRARQQVQIHFRDRFRYPRIARQRGWEGRVVLTFRLQPDGRITDVEVSESSGRSILDENARQTLIHIQHVPELADRMGQEPLELEVPVTYRLQPA